MPWAKVFDQSFKRVPIKRLPEAYAAGFRGMAGYAGGGSSDKWLTAAEIAAWKACGPDTFVPPMFEIAGTEPVDYPSKGGAHARAARDAWSRLGCPTHVAIAPAVDENVGSTQWRGPLSTYFYNWKTADRTPVVYVEADAGAFLHAGGLTAGTFTPAAWAWNSPAVLYTPDNAPAHVVWTQERNGQNLAGGDVDEGHIRTDAACIWWLNGEEPMGMVTVPTGYSSAGEQIPSEQALSSLMRYMIETRNLTLAIRDKDPVVVDVEQLAAQLAPKLAGVGVEQVKAGLAAILTSAHIVVPTS